jgi:hypothetical protein
MDVFTPNHNNTKRKNKREIAFGIFFCAGCVKSLAQKESDTKA